jgi:hypothetical protein
MRELVDETDLNEMSFEHARWVELGEVRVEQQNGIARQMCLQNFTLICKICSVQITKETVE